MSIVGQPVRAGLAGVMSGLRAERGARLGSTAIRLAQKHVERSHSRVRRELLKMDQQMGKTLAFSGSHE